MISWRLIVPAVSVAAAIGRLTYFVTPSPPVEAIQRLPPTSPVMKGPDRANQTNVDQHSSAEEEAKAAFERAAAAILGKHRSHRRPSVSMSHLPLSKSPYRRGVRYRAHDSHAAAISISSLRAKGLQSVNNVRIPILRTIKIPIMVVSMVNGLNPLMKGGRALHSQNHSSSCGRFPPA